MKYDKIKDIEDNLYSNGGTKEYWACILYFSDYSKSPIRNVAPTKVTLTLNMKHYESYNNLKTTLRGYNSSWLTVSSSGKKQLKHSGKCGGGVDDLVYFDNEEECQDYYNQLVFLAIKGIKNQKEMLAKKLDKQIEKMKKSFHNSDYMIETLRRS